MLNKKNVTLRAILLSIVLIPLNSYFSIQTPTPTTVSLIYTVIFNLFFITLLNLILKRFVPKIAFSQGELLTVYVMLSLSTIIAGHDMMQVLGPILGHAFWFATPENEWKTLFFNHLPDWLTVSNKETLRGHYESGFSIYNMASIKAWLEPVFWWSLFFFVLMFVMLCINALLVKQWTEREKLSYPIIQLPMRLTYKGGSSKFFTNRLLWLGFGIAGLIDLINGTHSLIPSVPEIPTRSIELGRYFTEKPLSAIGWTPVCFFPFAIGLSFFMPLSLSFSCWIFYWFWKSELILGDILGLRSLPQFPYIKSQASGAYFAIGVFALWSARSHLKKIGRQIFGSTTAQSLHYKKVALCLFLGLIFIFFFCIKAGMSPWIIVLFFIFYFGLSIAIVRLRAELGAPVNELYNMGPDLILMRIFGARKLGTSNLTVLSLFWGFNRSNRCHPMPHQLEGFKLAEQTGMSAKRLTYAMIIATFIGTLAAFWAYLDVRYRGGFGGGFGWEPFNRLARWLQYSPGTDYPAVIFMFTGFAIVSGLTILRYRFIWWPLHPVAYPLASSLNWSASWLWFSIFVSWLVKSLILRHGGLKLYRQSIPFFLGLILGDFIVGGSFNIYGVLTHTHTYTFWH